MANSIFERHGKKLLAVASALLMIVFISPMGRRGDSRENPEVGRIGDTSFTQRDVEFAKAQVQFLDRGLVFLQRVAADVPGQPSQERRVPLIDALADRGALSSLIQGLNDDPRLLMLLNYEASANGLAPTPSEVDAWAKNERDDVPQIGIVQPDGRVISVDDDPDRAPLARAALSSFLSINGIVNAATNMQRVSEPQRQKFLADQIQTVTLGAAVLPAKAELKSIPQPTAAQLRDQFLAFDDVQQPAPVTADNPFGFGYKYPARAKLQYIEVPADEVRRAVKASKSDYDWDVAARAYYLKHRDDFATTEPAPLPATMPAAAAHRGAAATQPASTQPVVVIKPYDQVKQQVIEVVMAPLIDELSGRVETKINSLLQTDWSAYTTNRDVQEKTRPGSGGVALDSDDYLSSIKTLVQNDDEGVICKVQRVGTLMGAQQLRALPSVAGLMDAATGTGADVASLIEADPPTVAPYQPSDAMHDSAKSVFFVRFSEIAPPQRPASMDEGDLRTTVLHDWQTAAAFKAAKQRAEKLVAAAAQSSPASAAKAAKLEWVTTTPFAVGGQAPPQLDISEAGAPQFRDGVSALLGKLTVSQPPLGVIAVPADQKVIAAQVMTVTPLVRNYPDFFRAQLLAEEQIGQALRNPEALASWFDLDQVMLRLHYADTAGSRHKAATGPT